MDGFICRDEVFFCQIMKRKVLRRDWKMKKIVQLTLLVLVCFSLVACTQGNANSASNGSETDNSSLENQDVEEEQDSKEKGDEKVDTSKMPVAIISTSMGGEKLGDIKIQLRPDVAENTVNNFIKLSREGFYDGLIFHRIIEGFMIQGGDPDGIGVGGPGYGIKGEFKQNGHDNNLSHDRGVISMARSASFDSAGSQFFICHQPAPHLNGAYASFGTLVSGEESLDRLASVKTGQQDRPSIECKIEKITIELNGYEAKEPEIIK